MKATERRENRKEDRIGEEEEEAGKRNEGDTGEHKHKGQTYQGNQTFIKFNICGLSFTLCILWR